MPINKCNIINNAVDKVVKLQWGTIYSKGKDTELNKAILENYLYQLNCSTLILDNKPCYPDSCSNPTTVFNCSLLGGNISSVISIDANTITFSINTTDIVNGLSPYTYLWTFDDQDLILDTGSSINTTTLILKPKTGKDINSIVAKVSIKITDSNNCTYIKDCYFVAGNIQCINNYIVCVTPVDLVIQNIVTVAVPPSGLIVEPI